MTTTPELLNTEQAAKLLRVSPAALYRWRKAGTGPPFVMVGMKIFYTHQGLNEWLESQKRQPMPKVPT